MKVGTDLKESHRLLEVKNESLLPNSPGAKLHLGTDLIRIFPDLGTDLFEKFFASARLHLGTDPNQLWGQAELGDWGQT